MTISIYVSVNGNYKAPVKVVNQNGDVTETVVSGRGSDGPKVHYIDFYHGNAGSVVEVTVGPESQDNGDDGSVADPS